MGSGIYSIGVSSLQNAQLGLATTSHNIANANTEGYSRQRIIQVSNVATLTGAGYVGQGAHVSTIERIYSSYVAKQVYTAQTKASQLEAYSTSITQLNNLLLDEDAGLASALDGFFEGVNQVSADPSSLAVRQTMVSSAEALVSRFQSLNSQIDAQYESINTQVQGYVTSINSYAQQIATLNKQIIVAEASTNQPPNDLYDQRDRVVAELNELIGVQTTTNSNGSLNVFFGNGQQLVVGMTTATLKAVQSSSDPSRLTVGIVNPAGVQELPESVISGGALAGILQYRSETLDKAANELGRIAASLALTFNAQHAEGRDLLGNVGGLVADFFNVEDPTVIGNANNPTNAAGEPEVNVTATFTTPSQSSDGTFYTNLTTSDYRLDYNGSGLTLTSLSNPADVWTGADIAAINTQIATSLGFSISADAAFSVGETYSYVIQPTRNAAQGIEMNDAVTADVRLIAAGASSASGVSDNRNALLLAQLQTGKTMDGNTASFATAYAQMVSDLGNKGNEVKTLLAAQTTLLTEAEDARDSVSGVNLDEEAAKLIEYQQAYQAAAKMLQIASELFDSILAIR